MADHSRLAAQRDQQWHGPGLGMDPYAHRSEGALRSFLVVALICVMSGSVTIVATRWMGTDKLLNLLTDLWYLGGIVGGAVCAVLYRLYTDTVQVGKLDERQRIVLTQIVQQKSVRLWLLLSMLLAPVGAAYVAKQFPGSIAAEVVAALAFAVGVAAIIFFFVYVPATWRDLREFAAELNAETARKERAEAALKRLGPHS